MNDVPAIFEEHASTYETQRRRLIPSYDAFYGTAVGALALARRPLRRILDLGAGTGIFSRAVHAAHPEAELTLLDGSPAMLAEARTALGDNATYVSGDLADAPPPGPWDAIVSALAIHHLDDPGKRALFARCHHELAPGAMFVNAEQVSGPTALFDDVYASWHEREAIARGASADEWAAACERMRLDRWASVEHQLAWLRDAGFADADCLFKEHRFAVLVARRAG